METALAIHGICAKSLAMPETRRIGTEADTPHTLRLKAGEFRRLAVDARDPRTLIDLKQLAEDYERRAVELELVAQVQAGGGLPKTK
jgi:hypothetical protein